MKAKYIGASIDQIRWGSNDDPRDLLEIGKEYDVVGLEVHTMHTKVILTEFPDLRFNSVCFDLDSFEMAKAFNAYEDNLRRVEKNYPFVYYP